MFRFFSNFLIDYVMYDECSALSHSFILLTFFYINLKKFQSISLSISSFLSYRNEEPLYSPSYNDVSIKNVLYRK